MEIGTVKLINIEEEMQGAYLDFAMSVITARALPDVRDGLKPVQRRILYVMHELGLTHTSPYKKSARIVGEVLGKYHPHGESAVYDAMVRLAQDFSMRYPLVGGQGNFGSVDGDPAAAMRYTEGRLSAIAEELLADIDKDTVDFAPNFDGSLKEPSVLPGKLPNLLVNGSSGIAVGMATNIPPHNLGEVVDAIADVTDRIAAAVDAGVPFDLVWAQAMNNPIEPELLAQAVKSLPAELAARLKGAAGKSSTREEMGARLLSLVDEMIDVTPDRLMEMIKGPDFPTGAIIVGTEGIKSAYTTGHGRITIRARVHTEDMRGNRQQLVVTELPFQINKANLIEKIADLIRDRRVEGIGDLRDESDREGMRIVVELKRDVSPQQVLNHLYRYTAMQSAFSVNLLALVDGQPRVLTLKAALFQYINYRKTVITRRTEFELGRAKHRAHILEGLKIALDHLDEVIATIRAARDADAAREALIRKFKLSEIQAQAILDMQLRRLVALERRKIIEELAEVQKLVARLEDLLAHPIKIARMVKDELVELKTRYGDARRTAISGEEALAFTEEDLIPDQEVVVLVSARDYVKRVPADSYRSRGRGQRNQAITPVRDDDPVQHLLATGTRQSAVFFTNKGRAFTAKVHELPDAGRQARGAPLSTVIKLAEEEKVTSVLAVPSFEPGRYCLLVSRGGEVKRVAVEEIASARSSGLAVFGVPDGGELAFALLTDGEREVILATAAGQAIRFKEEDVRASGRGSGGVRAIRVGDADRIVGVDVVDPTGELVIVSRSGYAKRVPMADFPTQGRGGGGVVAMALTPKTGPAAAARVVNAWDEVVISTSGGLVIRAPVESIAQKSRPTQGTPIALLESGDAVVALARVPSQGGSPNGTNGEAVKSGALPKADIAAKSAPATEGPEPANSVAPAEVKATRAGKKEVTHERPRAVRPSGEPLKLPSRRTSKPAKPALLGRTPAAPAKSAPVPPVKPVQPASGTTAQAPVSDAKVAGKAPATAAAAAPSAKPPVSSSKPTGEASAPLARAAARTPVPDSKAVVQPPLPMAESAGKASVSARKATGSPSKAVTLDKGAEPKRTSKESDKAPGPAAKATVQPALPTIKPAGKAPARAAETGGKTPAPVEKAVGKPAKTANKASAKAPKAAAKASGKAGAPSARPAGASAETRAKPGAKPAKPATRAKQ